MDNYVTVLLKFDGQPNKILKVDSTASISALKKHAATKCNITNPATVTLEYFDKMFKTWVEVDEDYELTDKHILKVVFVDEKGNIVEVCNGYL